MGAAAPSRSHYGGRVKGRMHTYDWTTERGRFP